MFWKSLVSVLRVWYMECRVMVVFAAQAEMLVRAAGIVVGSIPELSIGGLV